MIHNSRFIPFNKAVLSISLPKKFTFPFYYTPHPLSIIACEQVQKYLESQNEWKHNFGLRSKFDPEAIGKMFGVLVVQNANMELGYLAGFSGKLAGRNHFNYFVPPVYDVLNEDDFYKPIEEQLNILNDKIEKLENENDFLILKKELQQIKYDSQKEIEKIKAFNRNAKKNRKAERVLRKSILSKNEYDNLLEELSKESVYNHYVLKDAKNRWNDKVSVIEQKLMIYTDKIAQLKTIRKQISSDVQKRIFEQYSFKNINGQEKNLLEIFQDTFFQKPPAGAGECAAPKLLQYAFNSGLKPIALAEFWWGQSPKSEIRKHKHYYPACKGKCEPILGHMLKGLEMEANPLLKSSSLNNNLKIHYEDEAIVIVNKPHEFLSVPGKEISDSVLTRLQKLYPDCGGPLLLHRLDMSTSGILLMAKTEKYHRFLQKQFINRTINKRYIALLDGAVVSDKGIIDLPLRGDLYDRPRQIVCEDYGKESITKWKLLSYENGISRVHFFPKTGRTHQLRVHAAHFKGLDTPIVGDDLYGKRSERLMLHAEYLSFIHPVTRKEIEFTIPSEF